ncbi:MAG TPA: acyl-protein synthetase [Polyangiales bacterium]|nr:acyl-protein synthetase [Polyangiales bacterium]
MSAQPRHDAAPPPHELEATRAALVARSAALITALAHGGRDDRTRDQLLREVLAFQRAAVPAYGRIVAQLGPQNASDPLDWPAVPTDVFRVTRVAAHPAEQDVKRFRTSGTSSAERGEHALRELRLYDLAARAAARHALFPDVERMPLVLLAPRAEELPDSSLSYMLDRFGTWFGAGPSTYALHDGALDHALLVETLQRCERDATPVALLGTSFAFVHAEDALGAQRFALPRGSRIMQTGGFKGRSRTIEPEAMLELLAARYGIDPAFIVQEYGMTELSSQLYETTLRDAALGRDPGPRRLWVPGWLRVNRVDAGSLLPVAGEREGLLRIDDLANIDSACAIQTSDRALPCEDGIRVLGRAEGATPRGCSLAIDAVLSGSAR